MLITTPSKFSGSNNKNTISISSQTKTDNKTSSFSNSPIKLYCQNISEINKQNENGWTPLYRSIIANNLEILKELLKYGADPNLTNNIGETPLYLCVDIDNYEALDILLKNNADGNISKKDGTTPLHLAVKKKKDEFIKILLANKANPNLTNKLYSQTPTHLAIINKSSEDILLCFKKNGADFLGIKDKYEKTPFDYAKGLNDEDYLNIVKKILEIKEDKKENESKNDVKNNNSEEIKANIINDDNNIEGIKNLENLFQNINLSIKNNEKNKDNNKDDINDINIEEENDNKNNSKEDIKIIENKINNKEENYGEIKNEKNINNDSINNKNFIDNNITKYNYSINKPQIYQPKKTNKINHVIYTKKLESKENDEKIDNININQIKNNKIIKNNFLDQKDKNSLDNQEEEELFINDNELLTAKGRNYKHNLGMGIKLTSSSVQNIHKSKTENRINTSISNDNHIKLSTLSENEFLKNIIVDTAKKIKKNSSQYHNNILNNVNNVNTEENISLDEKSNSGFSPINTLKTESDKNKINKNGDNSKLLSLENGISNLKESNNDINKENIKEKINDMNPLDLMNQVINTNSNKSNDTQEQLLNNNFSNTINNNVRGDSDLLEYSKSGMTNQTNINNNTDDNTLTIKNNNMNNNSNKKNEYKKISYHCMHKNKGINLINNNNFNNYNENDEEYNINDEESNAIDDIEDNNKIENINSLKYKNLNKNNQTVLSTYNNSNYNSILTQKNKNNSISSQYNTNSKKIEDDILKNNLTPNNKLSNSNSQIPIPYNNSNYTSNYYSTYNTGHAIGNSSSNTTNNSSMKKYAKKLTILNELDNSKYNNKYNLNNIFNQKTSSIMPIKTNSSNELLTNENEQSIKLGSPQNIPNNLSSKLHDWLISCDLLCYYNLLIKNKIYNIEEYVDKIKKNKISISFKNIEDLGIKKPGHIFRFLLKLKIDSGLIDPFIYNVILDKYNRNSLNDIKINSSNNGFGCCCFRENYLRIDKKSLNNVGNDTFFMENCNDIFSFLKRLNLLWLKENFIHNGFDQVEFIMIQMFSEYKSNFEILNEYLHIYNDEDKKKVLKKLFEEKKNICNEYNIEYEVEEEKEILTARSGNNKIESNTSCIII